MENENKLPFLVEIIEKIKCHLLCFYNLKTTKQIRSQTANNQ